MLWTLSITTAINYLFIYFHINLLFFLIVFTLKHSNFRYITDLRKFNNIPLISTFFIFIFFSFAGLPPFLGFFGKFFVFWLTIYNEYYFSFFVCLWFALFSGYFYVQNIRYFLQNDKYTPYFINNNFFFFNTFILYLIWVCSIINIFGFVFFNDYFFFAYYLSYFLL